MNQLLQWQDLRKEIKLTLKEKYSFQSLANSGRETCQGDGGNSIWVRWKRNTEDKSRREELNESLSITHETLGFGKLIN